MTRARSVAIVAVALVLRASAARAQPPLEPGRLEIGFGPQWTGGTAVGSRDANETTGTGNPFTLFASSSEIASATGIEARVGVRLLQRLDVEGVGSYAAPSFIIHTAADSEGATGVAASERVQQFTVHGAAVWYVLGGRLGARTAPFVTAGFGYLRHVHENDVLLASGSVFEAGGGIKQLFVSREQKRLKGAGVRLDVRALARRKGIALDGGTHVAPALSASFFVRF
jgi:hypothetical protein